MKQAVATTLTLALIAGALYLGRVAPRNRTLPRLRLPTASNRCTLPRSAAT